MLSLLGVVVSLVGAPYTVLMLIFVNDILDDGPFSLGLRLLIAISAGGFGASLVAFSFSRHIVLSTVLLYPVGLFMMMKMASSNTLIQSMTPDHLRDRVMAAYASLWFARVLPQVRSEARELIVATQAGAGDPPEENSLGFSLAQRRPAVAGAAEVAKDK